MAKGLRSKIKRKHRTEFRKTHGKVCLPHLPTFERNKNIKMHVLHLVQIYIFTMITRIEYFSLLWIEYDSFLIYFLLSHA